MRWGAERGTLTATTGAFSIDVCEGCDHLFGGSLADDFVIPLTGGQFSGTLARLLGVAPQFVGGEIEFGLEDISGDPSTVRRDAFDHRGAVVAAVTGAAVPEPGLFALSVAALAVLSARRRRAAL